MPTTGVAAKTEVKKATLAERRVFTKLAQLHLFIDTSDGDFTTVRAKSMGLSRPIKVEGSALAAIP